MPVEREAATPRAPSASRNSCASRRSGASARPLSAPASRSSAVWLLPELVGPVISVMRRFKARAVAKWPA